MAPDVSSDDSSDDDDNDDDNALPAVVVWCCPVLRSSRLSLMHCTLSLCRPQRTLHKRLSHCEEHDAPM